MQVCLHVFKGEVNVAVIVGLEHVAQLHDVLVPPHLLQEYDFPKRPLRIRRVLEGIEDLLQSDYLPGFFVTGLPHDAIGPLPQFLYQVVLFGDVLVDLPIWIL